MSTAHRLVVSLVAAAFVLAGAARAAEPTAEEQARRATHLLEYLAADYPGVTVERREGPHGHPPGLAAAQAELGPSQLVEGGVAEGRAAQRAHRRAGHEAEVEEPVGDRRAVLDGFDDRGLAEGQLREFQGRLRAVEAVMKTVFNSR